MNLGLLDFLTCLASFCVPFILFFLIYLCQKNITDSRYWSSLPIRRGGGTFVPTNNNLSMAELGLNKEMRAMLPIVIFKESLSVKYSQCSVCLGDYEADEKLQQMPECGHIFHMECIDLWLTSHTTCPLCRVSLLFKSSVENPNEGGALAQAISYIKEVLFHTRILYFLAFVLSLVLGIAFHLLNELLFFYCGDNELEF